MGTMDDLERRVAEALSGVEYIDIPDGTPSGFVELREITPRIAAALRATATVAYRWPSGDDANDALSAGLAALEGK